MSDGDSLKAGDEVLVRGHIEEVFEGQDLVTVTFDNWWPRWSAVLTRRDRVAKMPAPPAPRNPKQL